MQLFLKCWKYCARISLNKPSQLFFMCSIIQWNLPITDTLGLDIFGHFLLQYRDFALSEVKNVLVTPFGTKIFVLIMEVFSIESLIRTVC